MICSIKFLHVIILFFRAALEENPYFRLKKVVKWYLSGFYKKPKGLKKPYNPILGETFHCLWIHPRTNSKTFYIAEQVLEMLVIEGKLIWKLRFFFRENINSVNSLLINLSY